MRIRPAAPLECDQYCPAGCTWGIVIDEGEITGHLFISEALGQAFGHDTRVWSTDRTAALRLWRHATKELRERGFERVLVHFDHEDPEGASMRQFWERVGFKPRFEVYEGAL